MATTYESVLGLLKYTGLVIGTASSLWSATTVEAKEQSGRKKLTKAGKISLAFVIVGFAIALVSNILEDRVNLQKENAKALRELETTNRLILASQPLTSLQIDWTFEGIDQSLVDSLSAKEKEENDHWDDCFFNVPMSEKDSHRMNNYFVLYPFLDYIAQGSPSRTADKTLGNDGKNLIALISLDTSHSALLAVGDLEQALANSRSKPKVKRSRGLLFSGGVRVYAKEPCAADVQSADVLSEPYIEVKSEKRGASIQWTLDPFTFDNSVDRSVSGPISAGLPPRLGVMILSRVRELPFVPDNFAIPGLCPIWEDSDNDSKIALQSLPFSKSFLKLIPNGRGELATRYTLESVRDHCVLDEYQENCQCGGRLLEFKAEEGSS
jgi:hypothetical protein